jgi:hypothetical protein
MTELPINAEVCRLCGWPAKTEAGDGEPGVDEAQARIAVEEPGFDKPKVGAIAEEARIAADELGFDELKSDALAIAEEPRIAAAERNSKKGKVKSAKKSGKPKKNESKNTHKRAQIILALSLIVLIGALVFIDFSAGKGGIPLKFPFKLSGSQDNATVGQPDEPETHNQSARLEQDNRPAQTNHTGGNESAAPPAETNADVIEINQTGGNEDAAPSPQTEANVIDNMERGSGPENNAPETAITPDASQNPRYTYNGHEYSVFLGDDSMEWEVADGYCKNAGGYLLSINSEGEQEFISGLLKGLPDLDYWIGLNRANGFKVWSSGEDVTYTNWAKTQPDSEDQEYGVIANGIRGAGSSWEIGIGQWDDNHNDRRPFICEWGTNWDEVKVRHILADLGIKRVYLDNSSGIVAELSVEQYPYYAADDNLWAWGSEDMDGLDIGLAIEQMMVAERLILEVSNPPVGRIEFAWQGDGDDGAWGWYAQSFEPGEVYNDGKVIIDLTNKLSPELFEASSHAKFFVGYWGAQ